jgi:hypothetical protein
LKRTAHQLLSLALFCVGLAACLGASCKREPAAPVAAPKSPTIRVFVATNVAGALEPCGCVKDMLGGVDHAAELAAKSKGGATGSLFVGAGPMLFLDPKLKEDRKTQELWKAEALAQSLGQMGLAAWAPGANDWAAGEAQLESLRGKTGAALLAGNLEGKDATKVVEVSGVKVGLAGVSMPAGGVAPKGSDPKAALENAMKQLDSQGAKVKIALIALPRGEALRLLDLVHGFQLAVVGKPAEEGDTNDAPTPPVLLERTLVVQTPNHLQGVAVVDLFVRGEDWEFEDGSGIANAEKREALTRRIEELESAIKAAGNASPEDVAKRRADHEKAQKELKALSNPPTPDQGSFFRYDLSFVREDVGTDSSVAGRLKEYYKRVNEHNKVAFADRKPAPVAAGESGFIGVERCATCHAEEHRFWQGTSHAAAYATLERQNKQFNLDCVDCHVTGYDKPGGSTVTFVDKLTNVQCENCHGPGSRHAASPANPDFIAKSPEKSLCAPACHHPPHVKPNWSVDEAWKKIVGPGHGAPVVK